MKFGNQLWSNRRIIGKIAINEQFGESGRIISNSLNLPLERMPSHRTLERNSKKAAQKGNYSEKNVRLENSSEKSDRMVKLNMKLN